ncbi:MAG TPA: urate hydroxylase PuuD [Bacteroidota bacterium]|nr:urate hydroxylase PuuD [Bacteroidota bacterium]
MDFDIMEVANLALRWIHVFAGIMWVGQTYFFTWLDGRFTEMENAALSGKQDDHVWMVHSGGFYLVGKQKNPKLMPSTLHWFRWEAAITWLSGILLLVIVYYWGGLMVSEQRTELEAILIGVGLLILAWPVYDGLWRSKLAQNEAVAVAISYLLLVGASYGLTRIMEPRPAFMHVGAMMGTLMTVNVWARILPAQRKMVANLQKGEKPDLSLGDAAKARSKHNTFMAVPVVFIMISNHYPITTYGNEWNWVILSLLILIGWGAAKLIRRA